MAPDEPRAYPLTQYEYDQLMGTPALGATFEPHPDRATGAGVRHVVVSEQVAHAVQVGHAELQRRRQRKRRAARASRRRNR